MGGYFEAQNVACDLTENVVNEYRATYVRKQLSESAALSGSFGCVLSYINV